MTTRSCQVHAPLGNAAAGRKIPDRYYTPAPFKGKTFARPAHPSPPRVVASATTSYHCSGSYMDAQEPVQPPPPTASPPGPHLQISIPHGFEWNRYSLSIPALPRALEGFRIAQIT